MPPLHVAGIMYEGSGDGNLDRQLVTDGARVFVGPVDHPWRSDLELAARRGGAVLVESPQSNAVIWLTKRAEDGLADVLHDGVEWVQLRSAGIDRWLARGELDARRRWTAAQGIYAECVAEHALALVLAGLKHLHEFAHSTSWAPDGKDRLRLLRDCTVVIIGAGGIGTELISYLRPLGPRIVAVTRRGRGVEGADLALSAAGLVDVLPEADVVVLAAPATIETHHLIGKVELAAMRSDSILVNVARGSLVDTDALVSALSLGGIGCAALDVTQPEPLPDGHPLWSEPRALVTPHTANPAAGQLPRLCARVEENVRRFIEGEPLAGLIDLEAGY